MTKIQTACYCLLASSFVLMGILIIQVDKTSAPNEANADQVISQANFSLMTARTRGEEESLFVLDNGAGTLVVYKPNVARQRLDVVTVIRMNDLFGNGNGNGDGGR